jgi:FkbM family methyltransferase
VQRGVRTARWFVDPFLLLLSPPVVPCSFTWTCHFLGKTFRIPVLRDLPRSWNDAGVWRWAGYRAIRKFYEFYIDHRPPGSLLDIGANDGMHTYPFAVHGWDCVCFEPQDTCIAFIEAVCRANGLANVKAVKCALSSEVGQVDFFVSPSSWYSSLIREHVERLEASEPIRVRATTLDEYWREHKFSPSFVKIDVEGAEWQVIEGARRVLQHFKPDVFVEVAAAPVQRQRIWDFFAPLGYRVYFVEHYSSRPFHAVATAQAFCAAGRNHPNADFILLADPAVDAAFRRTLVDADF